MLSHTRNRQSRWIKVIEAFEFEAATAPMAKAKPNSVSDRRYVADEKWHVKRDKSLIRNANWTNKTMYSISIYTIILLISVSLSVALIWGLYRPSSEPIALRNGLKRSTRHTLHIIRFWHFSSAVIITKNCVCAFNQVGAATSNKTHRERRMRKVL